MALLMRLMMAAVVVTAMWRVPVQGQAATPAQDRPALTPAQYEQAKGLVDRLRFANPTAESTTAVVEELLSLGEYGATQVVNWAGRDARSRGDRYLKDFEKAAGRRIRDQVPRDVEREVFAKREEVMAVCRAENLTKEMITSRSDPALKQLETWLTVSRETVLEHDEKLARDREALLLQVERWRKAADRLPADRLRPLPQVEEAERYGDWLREQETFAALMATPMSSQDRRVMLANFRIAEKMDPEEAAGIHKLNFMRIWLGIGALAIDPKLCDAARDHSKDMKEHNFFAHDSPVPGKKTPWDRARNFGTTANAENIFAGSPKGEAAIRAWWYSPGHHKNMLGNHNRVGLGRHDKHWTQVFGR